MAKRKAKVSLNDAEDNGAANSHSDRRDAIFAATLKNLAKSSDGDELSFMRHEDTLARCGGMAMPSLCLRWLFCQDTLPLGRVLTLSGLFRSNKTALSFEISRWAIIHHGITTYNSVEEKDSPDMRTAIFRHNPDWLRYLRVLECPYQETWQGSVAFELENSKKQSKVAMDIPVVSIVDSVAAAPPKTEAAKFLTDKAGAGARGYATVALLNSDWLKHIVHRVNEGPNLLLLIQHSTEQPVDGIPGATVRKQKGGMEVGFAKTMALEMTRVKDLPETDSGGGAVIEIKCTKNSLGPTNRKITVTVRWWWEMNPSTGMPEQHYVWDWHDASMALLLSFETAKGRSNTWKELKNICDLHGESRRRVWSKALGIPSSSPVSYREAMEILEYDHPELLIPIYNLLHISRRPILLPGADLREIWDGKVPVSNVLPPLPYAREPVLGKGSYDE